MREISGALVVIAGAIVFAASILSHSMRPSGQFDNLPYVGFLTAGVLALFGGFLILSVPPANNNRATTGRKGAETQEPKQPCS